MTVTCDYAEIRDRLRVVRGQLGESGEQRRSALAQIRLLDSLYEAGQ